MKPCGERRGHSNHVATGSKLCYRGRAVWVKKAKQRNEGGEDSTIGKVFLGSQKRTERGVTAFADTKLIFLSMDKVKMTQ